eukprot:TRINITY_DN2250_c0_g1_i1.p1 TRINITY_DN2250_c0_g1~~TRINITY_DN2250_c0_g1_i1.p1  ORF type:complete len:192 (-),score=28.05 TRINITY_DN2250_c0_g1_i1:36-611(-)
MMASYLWRSPYTGATRFHLLSGVRSVRCSVPSFSAPHHPFAATSPLMNTQHPALFRVGFVARSYADASAKKARPTVPLNFLQKDNTVKTVQAPVGDSILDIAKANDIDLEGACEGSLACSTCHVILEPALYESLSEPSEEENDMLDLAFGLTETSRLGCQIVVTADMANANIKLPAATRNIQAERISTTPK